MLKATELRLPVGADEATLTDVCAVRLGVRPGELRGLRILRKALDLRDKSRLEFVYTVAFHADDEPALMRRPIKGLTRHQAIPFEWPDPGDRVLRNRPLIVGAGPAGLFAAWFLARDGYAPIVLERGRIVHERVADVEAFDLGGPLDPESNYLFGEGGAGTFSDGKLTCRSTGPDTEKVLEIFAQSKGKPSILYEAKPHLGSNRLPAVVKALRRTIIQWGGEFRFGCRATDLQISDGAVRSVDTTTGTVDADCVILAIGHSARDTYGMLLKRGVPIEPKPFQMGVRIEQPQSTVNVCQYGDSPQARLLGPADYSMAVKAGDSELFTFCMCAGGYVMPSVSQHGYFCTNGMSRSKHESEFANSGLVVTVDPAKLPGYRDDRPLIGIEYQAAIERIAYESTGGNYFAPIQAARDFLAKRVGVGVPRSSYRRGVRLSNLWEILPDEVAAKIADGLPKMNQRWRGRFLEDATLVGPEARGSCPVRIPRSPVDRQAVGIAGLYPIGEGAGYAGGIVSAAVDGLRTARAIVARFRPISRGSA